MKNTLLIYFLSLITSLIVYYMFAMMATIAAGIDNLPLISFYSSILYFGISSWLFLFLPKAGRIIGIVNAFFMGVWPTFALLWALTERSIAGVLLFLIPLILIGVLIFFHLKFLNDYPKLNLRFRLTLLIIPLVGLSYYSLWMIGAF